MSWAERPRSQRDVRVVPEAVPSQLAFDVTPARLVTG